jgi:hypothetical protein
MRKKLRHFARARRRVARQQRCERVLVAGPEAGDQFVIPEIGQRPVGRSSCHG